MHSARSCRALCLLFVVLRSAPSRACEPVAWELRDVLRELVEERSRQDHALEPVDVDVAMRRRSLPFVSAMLRHAPKGFPPTEGLAAAPRPFGVCEVFDAPEVAARTASLQVQALVESLTVELRDGGWTVAAYAPEQAFAKGAELVVAASEGRARRYAFEFAEGRAAIHLPRGAVVAPSVVQVVATTGTGPEVVAETWVGNVEDIARGRRSERVDSRASVTDVVASLNVQRERLGVKPLRTSEALTRVAEQSIADSLGAAALVHRHGAGLINDRLAAAGVPRRRAGELLARLGRVGDAASRFHASPAHRAVLGDAVFRQVGVATAPGRDGLAWIVVVLATEP
jgi:uncharacterized protein YkwD